MPPGELAVRRGSHVRATDGDVGRVDEFLVDRLAELVPPLANDLSDSVRDDLKGHYDQKTHELESDSCEDFPVDDCKEGGNHVLSA